MITPADTPRFRHQNRGSLESHARELAAFASAEPGARIAILAPSFGEGQLMVEDYLLPVLIRDKREEVAATAVTTWLAGNAELSLPNNSRFRVYGADNPNTLRGPQQHLAWVSGEVDLACEAMVNLRLGTRMAAERGWDDGFRNEAFISDREDVLVASVPMGVAPTARTPRIGDTVHYQSFGSAGGEYASLCRAATITEVGAWVFNGYSPEIVTDGGIRVRTVSQLFDPEACGLFVMNPTGVFLNGAGTVPCVHDEGNPDGTERTGGTWHWADHG